MIHHIVLWTLKNPADAPRFKALLDTCAQVVPGMFFFLGIVPPDVDPLQAPANHSPLFRVHEPALKYGVRALAGGGRASARETLGRVAAGAVAKALLLAPAPVVRVPFLRTDVHDLDGLDDAAPQVEAGEAQLVDREGLRRLRRPRIPDEDDVARRVDRDHQRRGAVLRGVHRVALGVRREPAVVPGTRFR